MSKITHTHTDENGNTVTHTHEVEEHRHHGHYHSPEVKKRQLNRIAKAIGHLQHVKLMMENDEDCADVLVQLSAVESALHNLGKDIINEHITHCIVHAIEDGDTDAVEAFREAIKHFL
ncbi:MAG: metal-sensing transcriptional repressor [Erysipelotrichales bacterium]|nr:metal-sensing transcriptional repressor [Erysipelotrichales bacterium]